MARITRSKSQAENQVEPKEKQETTTSPEPAKKKQKVEKEPTSPTTATATGVLKEGSSLPSTFPVLTSDTEEQVNLYELSKKQAIVLFFYPKANTGGCTKQACGFRDHYDVFEKEHVAVFGVSADSVTSLANWKKKYTFQYGFLSDKEYKVIKALGVFKSPKGIKRSHIIIEKGGKIVRTQISVSPGDSFDDAVSFVKSGSFNK